MNWKKAIKTLIWGTFTLLDTLALVLSIRAGILWKQLRTEPGLWDKVSIKEIIIGIIFFACLVTIGVVRLVYLWKGDKKKD